MVRPIGNVNQPSPASNNEASSNDTSVNLANRVNRVAQVLRQETKKKPSEETQKSLRDLKAEHLPGNAKPFINSDNKTLS